MRYDKSRTTCRLYRHRVRGYEYNKKYPPNIAKYGRHKGGYPKDNQ